MKMIPCSYFLEEDPTGSKGSATKATNSAWSIKSYNQTDVFSGSVPRLPQGDQHPSVTYKTGIIW